MHSAATSGQRSWPKPTGYLSSTTLAAHFLRSALRALAARTQRRAAGDFCTTCAGALSNTISRRAEALCMEQSAALLIAENEPEGAGTVGGLARSFGSMNS